MKMKPVFMLVMLVLVLFSIYYFIVGFDMHNQVVLEEAKFHALNADYFSQAKSVRDAAESGSELNGQLVQIVNYPSELLRLKLVGVGRILSGIYLSLLGILMALVMMPVRLGMIMKKK